MTNQNVTKEELLSILTQLDKGTFVNILSETKVRMKKTDNPYHDKVVKKSKCNYLLGCDYGDRVGGNGEKEGLDMSTWVVQENKVGEHVSKCVLFNEKLNTHYVMVERFDEIKPQVEYTFEGNPIDKELFESYMTKVYENKSQPQERKVKPLSFKIDSIKEMSLNGVRYIVG